MRVLYSVLICAAALVTLSGCGKKGGPIVVESDQFTVGDVWLYKTRSTEPDSRVIVGRIENIEKIGTVVHLKLVGLNGLITLLTVYFFAGIAIVSYFFEKKRFPRILRFFLYSMIGLQQFILLMVIGLGFFDVWLNFRKLELKTPKKNE